MGFNLLCLIGMPYARRSYSSSRVSAAGGALVLFGSSYRRTSTLRTTDHAWDSAGVVVYGADLGDFSGYSVGLAGDVNGDGYDDVVIGKC